MATQINQPNTSTSPGPTYSFTLSWEENFNYNVSAQLLNNQPLIPFILSTLVYLPVIYIGQMLMRNREPFKLRKPLIIWNSGLAIFSIIGFIRVFPEFYHSLKNGFEYSICNNSWTLVPQSFWIYLFVLSKVVEFGDTLFLVLKKQKLMFLHVYHHATVLLFSWFVYGHGMAACRWYCTMNFGVHSIMYTYYALKALPNFIRIPKAISMLITILQTLQMIAGTCVVSASYYSYLMGRKCSANTTMSVSGLIIYVSYLILFSRFFYLAYCSPANQQRRDKTAAKVDKKRS